MPRYGLVLDITGAQNVAESERGTARLVVEHARALLRIPGLIRGLFLNPFLPFPGQLHPELRASPKLRWATADAFAEALQSGPVAYHVMSPMELGVPLHSIIPEFVQRAETPLLMTLYDVIPLLMPEHYLTNPSVGLPYRRRANVYRQADLVLALSRNSAADGVRLLDIDPARISVVGAGVSDFFSTAEPALGRRGSPGLHSGIEGDFVLCVTGTDHRKNTERLIDAYGLLPTQLRRRYRLVIVCRLTAEVEDAWRQRAAAAGLRREEVIMTGVISDQALRAMYRAAVLAIAPSLYEGFGLPVVEAIACGCPVICSSTSSMPEVLDDPRAWFDPTDPNAIAGSLERLLSNPEMRGEILAKGRAGLRLHTWGAVADRTAAALGSLTPPRPRTQPVNPQMRVALVGPLPPTRSGIADYNAQLIPDLARRCRLDVLYTGPQPPPAMLEARRFPVRALGRHLNPAAYDAIVYTTGNSEHHHETFDAARAHRGVIWMHDVRLGGFYLSRSWTQGRARDWLRDQLLMMYGPRIPENVASQFDRDWQTRYGLGLTKQWVDVARLVLVNSAFAEHLLRLDQAPNAQMPQVIRLPFAVGAALQAQADIDPARGDGRPVVATFGIVDPIKGSRELMEAMSLVREQVDARLVFVGLWPEFHRARLQQAVDETGLEGAVQFTGHVDDGEYRWWLRHAHCAVQLRTATNGEMSAAISDCLAAGLPVITNMLGVRDEYEPEAVVALDSSASADVLARQILQLLLDPALRARQSLAASTHTASHTFAVLADRLLEALETLQLAPGKAAS